jgi:hypothetical protein
MCPRFAIFEANFERGVCTLDRDTMVNPNPGGDPTWSRTGRGDNMVAQATIAAHPRATSANGVIGGKPSSANGPTKKHQESRT